MKIKGGFLALTMKYYYFFIIVISIITLSIFCFFIYRKCYKILTQIQTILVLKKEVALITPDKNLYEKVTANLAKRKEKLEINWEGFRNPFLPYLEEVKEEEEEE